MINSKRSLIFFVAVVVVVVVFHFMATYLIQYDKIHISLANAKFENQGIIQNIVH